MNKIQIVEATGKYLENWDVFINASINGTIFHKRKFLSYHGDRFKEGQKFLVMLDGNVLFAQISLTIAEDDNGEVIAKSPYGASYGGFIFQKQPAYHKGKEVVEAFIEYLKENNVTRFVITHPIACCSLVSLDTFYFNLLEQGFKSVNRDISNVVCLHDDQGIEGLVSSKARNMARKAQKNEIKVIANAPISDFWNVIDKTYMKLQKIPTHTKIEFEELVDLFPNEIYADVAYYNDIPVAGIGCFRINKEVNSSFYLCQDPEYQALQGLSLLVINILKQCQSQGCKYFDFGTSSANMQARVNIFSFKENYTKTGMFRETFEWKWEK